MVRRFWGNVVWRLVRALQLDEDISREAPISAACSEEFTIRIRQIGTADIRSGSLHICSDFSPGPNQASLRDAAVFARYPGNKLPGYYHSVPTGRLTILLSALEENAPELSAIPRGSLLLSYPL
jgi:hypothetical protein